MNLEDIRIFLEIEKSHSLSGAAETLFTTQSTVSRRLQSLETELEVSLFQRGKGMENVTLTDAGLRFLTIARQMQALANDANEIRNDLNCPQLSIAAPDSLIISVLKDFFPILSQRYRIRLITADSIPICEMTANHLIDIGITNNECPFSDLDSECFFEEDFVVLRRGSSAGYSLSVSPKDLPVKYEIAMLCGSTFNRWHNFWWNPEEARAVVNQAAMAAQMLITPDYWTILPRSAALAVMPSDGFIQTIEDDVPKRRCLIITSKNARPDNTMRNKQIIKELQNFITDRYTNT